MVSDNMDTISHRVVICYLGLNGLTSKEIFKKNMVITLGEDAPSYSMVKKWAAEFKRDRASLEDDPHPRRPVTITTQRERVLFNDAHNTFYLQLYGVRHMVKDHSDSEKGNPQPPHRLLLSINSKGAFISTILQTG